MRVDRRLGNKTAVGFSPIIPVAIVIAGVVAIGLLVAAHPAVGIALLVGGVVLVLLFARVSAANKPDPPPE